MSSNSKTYVLIVVVFFAAVTNDLRVTQDFYCDTSICKYRMVNAYIIIIINSNATEFDYLFINVS